MLFGSLAGLTTPGTRSMIKKATQYLTRYQMLVLLHTSMRQGLHSQQVGVDLYCDVGKISSNKAYLNV